MPNYDYHCNTCGKDFEANLSVDQRHWASCPYCADSDTRRIYQPTPTHFKGRGFYTTDKGQK